MQLVQGLAKNEIKAVGVSAFFWTSVARTTVESGAKECGGSIHRLGLFLFFTAPAVLILYLGHNKH